MDCADEIIEGIANHLQDEVFNKYHILISSMKLDNDYLIYGDNFPGIEIDGRTGEISIYDEYGYGLKYSGHNRITLYDADFIDKILKVLEEIFN